MFLTQIVNCEMTELALCEQCARERGFFDPQTLTFAEKFFPSMIHNKVNDMIRELAEEHVLRPEPPSGDVLSKCPICSYTSDNHAQTERVGCPHCYSVFAEDFSPELQQKLNLPAGGNSDAVSSSNSVPNVGKQELEFRLKQAIEQENYELAAQLRDQIKSMP